MVLDDLADGASKERHLHEVAAKDVGDIKGNIRGVHHGVSPKHLPRYLAEFCYRFNRRFWEPQMFNRMLYACLNTSSITFSELRQ
jgi:hypothetical protein